MSGILLGDALCALCAWSGVQSRVATAAEEPVRPAAHAAPRATDTARPTEPSRSSEGTRGEAVRGEAGRANAVRRQAAPQAPVASMPAYVPRPAPARASAYSAPPAHPVMNNGLALDARYNHGRYYAPVGAVTRVLPQDHRPYYLRGRRYYFSNGVWYATRGALFVVVPAPVGILVSSLPPFCTTVWFGGVPYYYANSTYYAWQPDQSGYAVVPPPDGAVAAAPDSSAATDDPSLADPAGGMGAAPAAGSGGADFAIYPKNGQSRDQQAADEYDCGNWAKSQTGFDPSVPDGGVSADEADRSHGNYDRALAACLQGRGYQLE